MRVVLWEGCVRDVGNVATRETAAARGRYIGLTVGAQESQHL